jgi:hypothetical protein
MVEYCNFTVKGGRTRISGPGKSIAKISPISLSGRTHSVNGGFVKYASADRNNTKIK